MTRTPDVVGAGPIDPAWGNEIRDRTVQVFATTAERDAWAAPSGAMCVVTANYAVYQRRGSTWALAGNYERGSSNYTSDASGICSVPHGLGIIPSACFFQAFSNPSTFTQTQLTSRTAVDCKVKCYNYNGLVLASQTLTIQWVFFR